jgi:hypothetical protein
MPSEAARAKELAGLPKGSPIWLCPAGQHACEKYERCAYGRNSAAALADQWDCPGPLTTIDELHRAMRLSSKYVRVLRSRCGLDAFAQPAEVWLEMSVAASKRGEHQYAKDTEEAMNLSLERWEPGK